MHGTFKASNGSAAADGTTVAAPVTATKIVARGVNVHYGAKHALKDVAVEIPNRTVTAFIGPSGCGKSTFLRCINRMNDTIEGCRVTGQLTIDGHDIYARDVDPVELRSRVGMVFQKPNPFPKSIFDNIAYGPRIHGLAANRAELEVIVEKSLVKAGLWDWDDDKIKKEKARIERALQAGFAILRADND